MLKLAEQLIVDLVSSQMSLDTDHSWVRDQNKKFEYDKGVYVIVGCISEVPFGVTSYFEEIDVTPPGGGTPYETLKEIQQVASQEQIQIDILSRNTDAITRRWEVLAALQSFQSQQVQELNQFRIFDIPSSFVNTSGTEGGSNLNKFSITIACHVWYRKETVLGKYDYYDDFNTRVDDEVTIGTAEGIIEFEIKDNAILQGNS